LPRAASPKSTCSSPSATTSAWCSRRTLDKDSIRSSKEALIEIYRKLRPGDPPTLETATNLFRGMFFDPRKYDFSRGWPSEVQHQDGPGHAAG